jgi:intein-encoded DNA endonuclease-like protein
MTAFLDFWVNGGIVELKELNMAYMTTFLHNFMDANGQIILNNKVYKRNPNFHIIATVNYPDDRIYK